MSGAIYFLIVFLISPSHQHGTLHFIPRSVSGCYHGEEGTFFWTLKGSNLLLNISAHISGDDWVAVGFSEDAMMGDDDVIAVFPSNDSYTVASLYNPDGHASTVYQRVGSVNFFQVDYHEEEISAYIVKNILSSHPISDLDKTPVHIFFAKGNVNNERPSTPLHKHYGLPTVSRNRVNLGKKGPVLTCISTKISTAIKIHGILMIIVWLNISLTSVYVARYAKFYFVPAVKWFSIHRLAGYLAGVLVVCGVSAAAAGTGWQLELHRHQQVGLGVLVGLLFHASLASCRPNKDTKYRRLWEIVHRVTALVLQTASITNIVNGLFMLKINSLCYWVLGVQIIGLCALFLCMEYPHQVQQSLNCLYRNTGLQATYLAPSTRRSTLLLNESDESSEGESEGDITMLAISLDHQPGSSLRLTKSGLYLIAGLNTAVCLVLSVCLVVS